MHDENSRSDDDDALGEGLDYAHNLNSRDPPMEHPCLALRKLLDDGTFYYSVDFDLTNRVQDRYGLVLFRIILSELSQVSRRVGVRRR